jgi:hypothetical protein
MEHILRLRYSLASLKNISPEKEELMTEWIGQMLLPDDDYQLSVSVCSDISETTWRVDTETKINMERYIEFMQFAEFKPIETELLKKVTTAFKGDLITWMNIGNEKQNTGWEIYNGIFPLDKVWGIIPESTQRNTLKNWLSEIGVEAFVKYGRSIAADTYSYINFELPGESIVENLELYYNLCAKLNLDPLPTPILDLIAASESDYIEITCYLSAQGLIKFGILIPDPTDSFVKLMNMVNGEGDLEMQAAFQGSLGSDDYTGIEIYRDNDGINSELTFSM